MFEAGSTTKNSKLHFFSPHKLAFRREEQSCSLAPSATTTLFPQNAKGNWHVEECKSYQIIPTSLYIGSAQHMMMTASQVHGQS
jgi:hypothetical protein